MCSVFSTTNTHETCLQDPKRLINNELPVSFSGAEHGCGFYVSSVRADSEAYRQGLRVRVMETGDT